jgi:hypothetical protein
MKNTKGSRCICRREMFKEGDLVSWADGSQTGFVVYGGFLSPSLIEVLSYNTGARRKLKKSELTLI